jgi:ElaB/YqjD/DUF883 family membrane-anchored ribosome-binding protein
MTQRRAVYPLDNSNGRPDLGKDRLREMADTTTDKFEDVTQSAEVIVNQLAEQAREYGGKAKEVAKSFKPYVENSMKDQPMATLAVASVIGFVLGAIWKR